VAAIEEGFAEVRSDEAGCAGDDSSHTSDTLMAERERAQGALHMSAADKLVRSRTRCCGGYDRWTSPRKTVNHMIFRSSVTDQFSM
jgi:hypothetical protein